MVWVGDELGDDGPDAADAVLGESDLDDVLSVVGRCPVAAVSLAMHLRAIDSATVDQGLMMESATYSTLQSGGEFAAWRAGSKVAQSVSELSTLLLDRHDNELTITLDRPQRHNAITAQLRDELYAALTVAVADESIESIRIRGNGPSFCSGGDLGEFGSRSDPATAHRIRLTHSPARLIHRLRERTTCEIHGSTIGGGIEMAAFADHVVAHPETFMSLPEVSLGLIPGAGGTVSVSRRIGRSRCAAIALTNRTISASTGLRWGLIDEIVSIRT